MGAATYKGLVEYSLTVWKADRPPNAYVHTAPDWMEVFNKLLDEVNFPNVIIHLIEIKRVGSD